MAGPVAVGADGRNRTLLSAFASRTGRNQPSNTEFIFGPAKWLRSLIRPEPGTALAYVDFSSQEMGIAAALSGKDGKNPEPCPQRRSYHSSGSGYYRSSYYSSSPSHWSTPIFARGSGAAQQTQAGRPPAGSSTSLGFSGIGECAARIETLIKQRLSALQSAPAPNLITEIGGLIARLEQRLRAARTSQP